MNHSNNKFNDFINRQERVNANYKLIREELKAKVKRSTTIKNVLNAIFIIGVSSVCFQQCYIQISEYLKYSVRSQISHSFPNSTLFLIPGVTICNNNRIRMNKLTKESSLLREKLHNYLDEVDSKNDNILDEEMRIKRMKSIREIVENTVNISLLINEKPISKLLDFSSCSMIKDVDCNGLWGRQFNCENFRIIESYQGVACYTLFFLGSILEALSNELAFDFNTTLLKGGRRKINSFEEHEIADILVDFEPFEHADFQRDIGGKIVIHSTGNIGSIRDMSYSIQPGRKYEILLSRRMTKRLPPPYKSMCVDYRGKNSHQFTTKQNSPPSIVLDTTGCTRNCIIKLSTKQCNCWPPEIPYFPDDQTIVDGSQNYKPCGYVDDKLQLNSSETIYVNCYKKFHSDCRAKCQRGCWTEDYKQHIISSQWPSRAQFLSANYEFEKKELERLRHCCAKISLKYMEYLETKQIMYPTMTLAQLVSNIGGIVSGLIGVSAVTLYRYLTRKIFRCKVVSNYEPKDQI